MLAFVGYTNKWIIVLWGMIMGYLDMNLAKHNATDAPPHTATPLMLKGFQHILYGGSDS